MEMDNRLCGVCNKFVQNDTPYNTCERCRERQNVLRKVKKNKDEWFYLNGNYMIEIQDNNDTNIYYTIEALLEDIRRNNRVITKIKVQTKDL